MLSLLPMSLPLLLLLLVMQHKLEGTSISSRLTAGDYFLYFHDAGESNSRYFILYHGWGGHGFEGNEHDVHVVDFMSGCQ